MPKRDWYGRLLGAVALAACGGGEPAQVPPIPTVHAVVMRVDPASAAQCPAGGSITSSGFDDNDNGVLDTNEIAAQHVMCNETPVDPVAVMRIVAEPAGANCVDGGTAVQSGLDRNGNGQLDDDEVMHTDYMCYTDVITRMLPEPAGVHCVAGGIAFQFGPDLDGNGQLDAVEVQRTEYECGDTVTRDVTLRTRSDVETFAPIRVIDGSLLISDPLEGPDGTLEEVVLPHLEQIRDTLTVSDIKLTTRLSLPALQQVGSTARISDNALLTVIEVPVLHRVGGGLDISRNPELLDLTGVIPPVVGGDVLIMDNPVLATAPVQVEVTGRIEVSGNDALAALELSATGQIGTIVIARNGVHSVHVVAPPVGGVVSTMSDLQIVDNPALQEINAGVGKVGTLEVARNVALEQLQLRVVEIGGDLKLIDNPIVDFAEMFGPDTLHVRGSVTLSDAFKELALFPDSRVFIGGDLTLENIHAASVPEAVRSIGGALHLRGNDLMRAGFARFSLGGSLEIRNNARLQKFDLLNQVEIHGDVDIASNARLAKLSSIEIVHQIAGHVVIDDNRALSALAIGATTIGGQLQLSNNPALAALSFADLHDAAGIAVLHNDAISELALPSLVSAPDLVVDGNAALHHLALPLLTEATSLSVLHNHQLPSCEVVALFAGITAQSKQQLDNDDTAACAR